MGARPPADAAALGRELVGSGPRSHCVRGRGVLAFPGGAQPMGGARLSAGALPVVPPLGEPGRAGPGSGPHLGGARAADLAAAAADGAAALSGRVGEAPRQPLAVPDRARPAPAAAGHERPRRTAFPPAPAAD